MSDVTSRNAHNYSYTEVSFEGSLAAAILVCSWVPLLSWASRGLCEVRSVQAAAFASVLSGASGLQSVMEGWVGVAPVAERFE
ncbi:hypothetical protein JZ751_012087 [Albula glossodonta]|uniref:Uncharacterized protein n=1 Tax=Albula glossodonta TaxID=121402 RepID=A0A8T2PRI2_9TELE|nr:hypothetical protein JZ751_012087 [Albula glossodonta]